MRVPPTSAPARACGPNANPRAVYPVLYSFAIRRAVPRSHTASQHTGTPKPNPKPDSGTESHARIHTHEAHRKGLTFNGLPFVYTPLGYPFAGHSQRLTRNALPVTRYPRGEALHVYAMRPVCILRIQEILMGITLHQTPQNRKNFHRPLYYL